MPEGDTVLHVARSLDAALSGRTVIKFELRVPRLALADRTGCEVTSVSPYGKHLFIRLGDGMSVHSHLRLDGAWRITQSQPSPATFHHQVRALIANNEWTAVGLRIHDIAIVRTTDEGQLLRHLGPDLLANEWHPERALQRWQMHTGIATTVSDSLLDQRIVAGIGNVYRCELLFLHGIHPSTPATSVPDPPGLLSHARELLLQNSEIRPRSTTGSRRHGEQYWVYGRDSQPCRRCGARIALWKPSAADTIASATAARRATYHCPQCQPSRVTA